jgi:hypothetical protein
MVAAGCRVPVLVQPARWARRLTAGSIADDDAKAAAAT